MVLGVYKSHSSIADCGVTGRKLAVDFYGGNEKVGGGSPWTKDGSKADLTLNLLARNIAKKNAFKLGERLRPLLLVVLNGLIFSFQHTFWIIRIP